MKHPALETTANRTTGLLRATDLLQIGIRKLLGVARCGRQSQAFGNQPDFHSPILAGVGVFDRRASALLGRRGRYGARSRHGWRFLRRSNPASLDAGWIERTAGAASTAQHRCGLKNAIPIQIAAPPRLAAWNLTGVDVA